MREPQQVWVGEFVCVLGMGNPQRRIALKVSIYCGFLSKCQKVACDKSKQGAGDELFHVLSIYCGFLSNCQKAVCL